MCTVTFLPSADRVLITSNRDESRLRATALLPEVYKHASGSIIYPKDMKAGGTWIALHKNGNAMVLLNGAFDRHVPHYPYRVSRGIIFLQLFDTPDPMPAFVDIDLDNIEPFTLVVWSCGALHEARWDGKKKFVMRKDESVPHIWSSATLYDKVVRDKREVWFAEWLAGRPELLPEVVMRFHEFAGDGDERISLRMNRDGILSTLSITCMDLSNDKLVMRYKDLYAGVTSVNEWFLSTDS